MLETPVQFRTNIDCCERLISGISSMYIQRINPQIGDNVRVYSTPDLEIWMKVAERQWIFDTNLNNTPNLICWLTVPSGWSISDFTAMMANRGFKS